jgi:hypothetical protein
MEGIDTMGPVTLTALIAGGAFLASLTFDIGLNVAQDWYATISNDAAWTSQARAGETPMSRELAGEEAEIDHLLVSDDFNAPPHQK